MAFPCSVGIPGYPMFPPGMLEATVTSTGAYGLPYTAMPVYPNIPYGPTYQTTVSQQGVPYGGFNPYGSQLGNPYGSMYGYPLALKATA